MWIKYKYKDNPVELLEIDDEYCENKDDIIDYLIDYGFIPLYVGVALEVKVMVIHPTDWEIKQFKIKNQLEYINSLEKQLKLAKEELNKIQQNAPFIE